MNREGRNLIQTGWAVALCVLMAIPVFAHHSFATYYLEQDTIELEGEILEFQYKNPHSWIHFAAQDPFGQQKIYAAEWGSTSALTSNGITKNTLRAGDVVRIWASPNR